MPSWVQYSERAFAFNFIAFSFVMFSCLFPTGFSATFSTLSFLFALPIFFYRISSVNLNLIELVGLLLFSWLLLSVSWSEASIWESFGYLSEYRIYFMLPVFITALHVNEKTQQRALAAAIIGAFVALISSYGLWLGWWQVEGAQLSLANRIYHGFIMSSLLLACLLIARENLSWLRSGALIASLLVIYNILNVENGRTGYLQVVFVCFVFVILTLPRSWSFLALVLSVGSLVVFYLSFDSLHNRVNQTVENVVKTVTIHDYESSAGYRIEFYRGAVDIGLDYPLTGVGVGDLKSTLQAKFDSGEMRFLTDNVHSEFMNMLIIGGIPAFLLFCVFVGSFLYLGISIRSQSRLIADAWIGLGVIILVSAIFNSTIKDHGEKHAILVMISILSSLSLKVLIPKSKDACDNDST